MSESNPVILEGSPLPTLLIFALPIILGNIFQQLYNVIDAIVIGKFLGNLSLAGISVANPLTDVVNALIIGGSIGIGVLAARIYGSGDMPQLKRTHATALLAGLGITVLLSALGMALSLPVLRAQGAEEAVTREALRYLYIILAGMPLCFLYNYYASLLRSCGDSRTPFVILLVSSLLHAALDYLSAAVLGFGIAGIACCTVVCQLFSALWCIVYTHRRYPALALSPSDLRFSFSICREVLGFAWAAALQQAVVNIGRLLVQSSLMSLGTDAVTGFNMGVRAEMFLMCFSQGISAALAVAVSQNKGHGSPGRMRSFYYSALASALLLLCLLGTVYKLFATEIIGLFSDNPAVIAAGAQYTGTMAYIYFLAFAGEQMQGFFRGLGRLKLTMVFSIGQMTIRVLLSYLLVSRYGIPGICISVVSGWVLQNLIEGGYSLYTAAKLKEPRGSRVSA